MDVYLMYLYRRIIYDIANKLSGYIPRELIPLIPCSAGLHILAQEIKGFDGITFNYNEDGRLHSKYLDDRYEPAVIIHNQSTTYYYLFDGKIKDCIHPFSIKIYTDVKYIKYYSSERIEQELPIYIIEEKTIVTEVYNGYDSNPLLAGYKHGEVETSNYIKQDYLLHDCMEPIPFKFAD